MKKILISIALLAFISSGAMATGLVGSDFAISTVHLDKGKKKKSGDCCSKKNTAACEKKADENTGLTEKGKNQPACCKKKDAAKCQQEETK